MLFILRQIIANYINIFRPSWYSSSVISIKDVYITPNIQIYLQIQNPKKLFTFGKKYLQACVWLAGCLGLQQQSGLLMSLRRAGLQQTTCAAPGRFNGQLEQSPRLTPARDGSKQRTQYQPSKLDIHNFIAFLNLWDRERKSLEMHVYYFTFTLSH